MKKLIITMFALGSFSVSAGCLPFYKDFINQRGTSAAFAVASIAFLPHGVYDSYSVHQARKMRDLIKEAKSSRVGKRTRGLMKSLNGLMSSKAIHSKVLKGNRKGSFCQKADYKSVLGQGQTVTLYRDFKNILRIGIDAKRVNKGLNPIWDD